MNIHARVSLILRLALNIHVYIYSINFNTFYATKDMQIIYSDKITNWVNICILYKNKLSVENTINSIFNLIFLCEVFIKHLWKNALSHRTRWSDYYLHCHHSASIKHTSTTLTIITDLCGSQTIPSKTIYMIDVGNIGI